MKIKHDTKTDGDSNQPISKFRGRRLLDYMTSMISFAGGNVDLQNSNDGPSLEIHSDGRKKPSSLKRMAEEKLMESSKTSASLSNESQDRSEEADAMDLAKMDEGSPSDSGEELNESSVNFLDDFISLSENIFEDEITGRTVKPSEVEMKNKDEQMEEKDSSGLHTSALFSSDEKPVVKLMLVEDSAGVKNAPGVFKYKSVVAKNTGSPWNHSTEEYCR